MIKFMLFAMLIPLLNSNANAMFIANVQPYRMCENFCQNTFDEAAYERVNALWAQADIRFQFAPIIELRIDGLSRFATQVEFLNALALMVNNPTTVLNLGISDFFSNTSAAAVANVNGSGSVVDAGLSTIDQMGFAIANSLGHNLGLTRNNIATNLMGFPSDFRTGDLTPEQIAQAQQSRFLSVVVDVPEPASFFLGFVGLVLTRLRFGNKPLSKKN